MSQVGQEANVTVSGINIQWPWSQLLLSGKKSVETRTYPLPKAYQGKWLALIETPGPKGRQMAGIEKARILGLIAFSDSFQYRDRDHWMSDFDRHLVSSDDPSFSYQQENMKWGWALVGCMRFEVPQQAPRRKGIIFTRDCRVVLPIDSRPTIEQYTL